MPGTCLQHVVPSACQRNVSHSCAASSCDSSPLSPWQYHVKAICPFAICPQRVEVGACLHLFARAGAVIRWKHKELHIEAQAAWPQEMAGQPWYSSTSELVRLVCILEHVTCIPKSWMLAPCTFSCGGRSPSPHSCFGAASKLSLW